MNSLLILALALCFVELTGVKLVCQNSEKRSAASDDFSVQIVKSHFSSSCPVAYDMSSKRRRALHMCVATANNFCCIFAVKDVVISDRGALIRRGEQVTFSDPSLCGVKKLTYHSRTYKIVAGRFEKIGNKFIESKPFLANISEYSKVIPMRIPFDDGFNHMSFQAVPMVGSVLEFVGLRPDYVCHASMFTAALLELIGVARHQIVMD